MGTNGQIEDLLKSARKVSAPPDFTLLVMKKVRESKEAPRLAASLNQCVCDIDARSECSLCFMAAGFYYLIVGVVITIGFQRTLAAVPVDTWIRLQPLFTIATALYLIVLGVYLLYRPQTGTRIATPGILLFLGFVVVNAVLVRNAAANPFSLIFLITLSVSGVVMSLLYFIEVIRNRHDEGWSL